MANLFGQDCPPGQVYWIDECVSKTDPGYVADQKRQKLDLFKKRTKYDPRKSASKSKKPASSASSASSVSSESSVSPLKRKKSWKGSYASPTKKELSQAEKNEMRQAQKEKYEKFMKNHSGTIFWTIFVAITLGLLAYENNYPTTKASPKSLVITMDIVFLIMIIMLLYAFGKYWKRGDTGKMSDSKKRLVWMYRLFFIGGLGFWSYYHFKLVPVARKTRSKVKSGFNFLHKLSIPMVYVSLFTLQALTMN